MSRRPTIAVLDYGMGNIRSVANAIDHVGGLPVVTSSHREAERADAAVLPGVGAFDACMRGIVKRGLDGAVIGMHDSGRIVLGVCLGMQVLFDSSEEGTHPGLEYLRGRVRRLPAEVKVPQIGWNTVSWTREHPLIEGIPSDSWFYFVHSYAPVDGDYTVGTAEYGRRFAAAVTDRTETIFATQFHPERSGDAGLEIYRNLVRAAA